MKEILLEDSWFFVENGFAKETLTELTRRGLTFKQINMLLETDWAEAEIFGGLRDYSHKVTHISLVDFMTDSVEKQSKKTYCSATLEIEYPKMPHKRREEYTGKILQGPIFDGGKVTREVAYSARYTDDGKRFMWNF
ncbi:hypothetical protein [Helicobacter sp. UBA3407]|uniref:hypothetical protein n=1 Tax=Helicobacter sp. UBA3407 TaxID=1946588 RepID=UPI0026215649|nr:hypothetical protein [Helicobacter sp. UBA3407]